MGKLFGTDGIRGIVGKNLDAPLSYRVGLATAMCLGKATEGKPLVTIGKDTRISSDMLECALSAGLCAGGANVLHLGVIPTPGVAYLTTYSHAQAGVVISASHNPYEYNGIKIFSDKGFKFSDEMEEEVERLVLSDNNLPTKTGADLGQVIDGTHGLDYYIQYLQSLVKDDLSHLRVLIDCSNGAASKTAIRIFGRFQMEVNYMNNQPNGTNINDKCGSTHLDELRRRVVEGYYDLGIAFDGDADRCLLVDELGNIIDGDRYLAAMAVFLRTNGKLKNNGFVATVMSNLGLHKFATAQNLQLLCADVGDRFVLETMQAKNMILGGEQSGHIIFLNHMTTGDGQLAALKFLQLLSRMAMPASKLVGACPQYPQTLINVPSPIGKADKEAVMGATCVAEAMASADALLEGDGRILLRPSGTEALIRVMVEAKTQALAEQAAQLVAESVKIAQK